MKRLAVVLGVFVLAGCAAGNARCANCYPGTKVYEPDGFSLDVEQFVDTDYGVVCYVYAAYGIDCLPISETELSE